jgi:hypothetical protein
MDGRGNEGSGSAGIPSIEPPNRCARCGPSLSIARSSKPAHVARVKSRHFTRRFPMLPDVPQSLPIRLCNILPNRNLECLRD